MLMNCCFCDEPVLEIVGQDDNLDSYYFKKEPEDDAAIAQGVYGDCHISCLVASYWCEFWRKRRLENFQHPRSFEPVFSSDGVQALRSWRTRQTVLLLACGAPIQLYDKDLSAGLDIEAHTLTILERKRWWRLPDGIKPKIGRTLASGGGKMPLLELERLFGVDHRLYDRLSASQSELEAVVGETDDGFSKGLLIANLRSVVILPPALISFLRHSLDKIARS